MKNRHVLVALLCVMLLLGSDAVRAGDKSDLAIIPVSQTVRRDVTDYADFTGRTETVNHVLIRARVSGYLTKVAFKEGGPVRQGDLLVAIDPRPYQVDLNRANAALAVSEARLRRDAANVENSQKLATDRIIGPQEVRIGQLTLAEAEANVRVAKAAVEAAQLNLSFMRVWPERIAMPVTQTVPALAPKATPTTDDAKPGPKDSTLRSELLDRVKKDQDARKAFMALMRQQKQSDPDTLRKADHPAIKQMQEIDRDNTAWLKAVVKDKGWPGKSLVGADGAQAAWLLVQHADQDRPFQKQCLELICKAFEKGEATGEQVAYLTDRVRVGEKKKQLYGTQLHVVKGKYEPQPIEDEERVDERRKEMGMMPLAEYLRFAEKALKGDGNKDTKRPDRLGPGDHARTLMMGEQKRTYLVHVPKGYDPKKPAPVVLALHGAAMNGSMMVWFSGLNKKSDEAGFILVYPSGTGTGPFLTWNAGGFKGKMAEGKADDVAFIGRLLDDLGTVVKVDDKRVYACGMSNGGMMCYRLAAELSDRIAAIAPVAGTIAIEESKPKRPVPVIHFHGTKDNIVPFEMKKGKAPKFMKLKGVKESVQTWVKLNGCDETPKVETISKDGDDMKVTRKTYSNGKEGAEVVMVVIEEGGHTWPGQQPPVGFIGKSAKNISANDLMWEFFQKHRLK